MQLKTSPNLLKEKKRLRNAIVLMIDRKTKYNVSSQGRIKFTKCVC